jgi:hypothetical protein
MSSLQEQIDLLFRLVERQNIEIAALEDKVSKYEDQRGEIAALKETVSHLQCAIETTDNCVCLKCGGFKRANCTICRIMLCKWDECEDGRRVYKMTQPRCQSCCDKY